MANAKYRDAADVFRAIAFHLASKRQELTLACRIGRGIETWIQHECMVAIDNAYLSDFGSDYSDWGREAKSARGHETDHTRPFDLWFTDPDMFVAIKFYPTWQPVKDAIRQVRKDLVRLAAEPTTGVFLLGKLDFRDGRGEQGVKRKKYSGEDWCDHVMGSARVGLTMRSLVPELSGGDDTAYLSWWLHPYPHWEEGDTAPRTPTLHLGAWQVYTTVGEVE